MVDVDDKERKKAIHQGRFSNYYDHRFTCLRRFAFVQAFINLFFTSLYLLLLEIVIGSAVLFRTQHPIFFFGFCLYFLVHFPYQKKALKNALFSLYVPGSWLSWQVACCLEISLADLIK